MGNRLLGRSSCSELKSVVNGVQNARLEGLTRLAEASRVMSRHMSVKMSVKKIQIGQLWRKNDTGDVYLVTRVYSEALSTIVVLRKSGAEDEALTRLRAESTPKGPGIPGYSPAQDEENF
jgi:hypothetical protein